ncbi:dehydratase [Pigmentiphaga sp. H8]|uniref:MaoC/PaaZ C-terminal domain-containing protein n=1 Tax=Pigmentiphaga sp. H8 TaxID=2488560 RepID=UPI000F594672|nr:MaoC/PaaZ C-terminal domain-containing protein [Pigmentiphaga sp. H8]AZG09166.1 dehydratase [Pigmentiphaga sp. H8]
MNAYSSLEVSQRLAVPVGTELPAAKAGPYFEDIDIGLALELVKPAITRLQIAKFAGASGDFNPSHVDEDIARDIGGMGGVFAHGMIGMGFLGQLLTDFLWDRPLRMFSTRATIIVRPGDSLTCRAKVTRKWVDDEDNLVEFELEAVNQQGEVTHTGKAQAVLPHRPLAIKAELKRPYLVQHRVIG